MQNLPGNSESAGPPPADAGPTLAGAGSTLEQRLAAKRERLALLVEAGRLLAAELHYPAALDRAAEVLLPRLADFCAIDLLEPDGAVSRVLVRHVNPAKADLLRAIYHAVQPYTSHDQHPATMVLRSGRPLLIPRLTPEWLDQAIGDPATRELMLALRVGSLMIAPLIARGRSIGVAIMGVTETERVYSEDEAAVAEVVALHIAAAIDNARLADTARAAIRTSEQSDALLDLLFTRAPIGLGFVDRDLRYMRVNSALAEMNGQPAEAHLGRTIGEIIPALAPEIEAIYRGIFSTGQPVLNQELRGPNSARPGTIGHWLCSYYPVLARAEQILGVGVVVIEVTQLRQQEAELQQSEALMRALSRRLVDAHEQERRHIARELHDEIGQVLTGLKLSLDAASSQAPVAMAPALDEARAAVHELMARVRALSLDLRPALLDDMGLLPALSWHLERYTARTGVQVELRHQGVERRFPPVIETAAFRIVQEALTNVARYAGTPRASVVLRADDSRLMVRIDDAGNGFDPALLEARTTGGLTGMRERARLLGATLSVETAPGAGTQVFADLPLAELEAEL